MKYNTAYPEKANQLRLDCEYHIKNKHIVEQKEIKPTRTNRQNNALHLYYEWVGKKLNDAGFYYGYTNIFTGEIIEIPWNKDLVKDYIWRPLQDTMFEIESTTKLKTYMINELLMVINNWLSEKGIQVNFPNRIDYLIEKGIY